MAKVTVNNVKEKFGLKFEAGELGISKAIHTSDISRPGLEMAGYFDYFLADRVQLLGKTELSFFSSLTAEQRQDRMTRFCSKQTPLIIVANEVKVPDELIQASNESGITVLSTDIPTTRFSGMLTKYLEGQLAPMTALHGVLVDVYGIGILITGKSGVGKSETALELVKRGHRLVADDLVEIRQVSKNVLIGNAPTILQHMLEIRGVGIIDMMNLFGASAVRDDKRVLMVIELEFWEENKMYERLGLDEQRTSIIDSEIPKLTIPVRPGRNLSVIIEVAAMDYRMKKVGVNAAEKFSGKLNSMISGNMVEEGL